MLHRSGIKLGADRQEQGFARGAVVVEHAHLDQLVSDEIEVDLVQHRCGESVLPDAHDRMQVMRLRAHGAPLRGGERSHPFVRFAPGFAALPLWASRLGCWSGR